VHTTPSAATSGRTIGSDVKTLSLSVENRGVWRSTGEELPALRGCQDIDLALAATIDQSTVIGEGHALRRGERSLIAACAA